MRIATCETSGPVRTHCRGGVRLKVFVGEGDLTSEYQLATCRIRLTQIVRVEEVKFLNGIIKQIFFALLKKIVTFDIEISSSYIRNHQEYIAFDQTIFFSPGVMHEFTSALGPPDSEALVEFGVFVSNLKLPFGCPLCN